MGIKLVFLLILGISALVWAYPQTACGFGPEHNLIEGRREPGDKLLNTTRVKMPKAVSKIQKYDFDWVRYNLKAYHEITRFEVLDQFHDGSGGCALYPGGGPGLNFFSIRLQTQKGGSFDFIINIYGIEIPFGLEDNFDY